ncbi:hypothetical protein ES703_79819 [subsurface metagenome]
MNGIGIVALQREGQDGPGVMGDGDIGIMINPGALGMVVRQAVVLKILSPPHVLNVNWQGQAVNMVAVHLDSPLHRPALQGQVNTRVRSETLRHEPGESSHMLRSGQAFPLLFLIGAQGGPQGYRFLIHMAP